MSKYDIILDVYENQSISKAAAKHNYTQSAVSQTIRNYEKEIGLKLFKNRTYFYRAEKYACLQ